MSSWFREQQDSSAETATRGWRWRVQAAGAAVVAGAMMLIATAAQAALSVCPSPTSADITACCRITKPGNYTVNEGLTGNGGACIKIEVSGVTLDGGGMTLTGNGTGIGIRLLPAAKGDVIFDIADISNFKTGILDDAPRSVIVSTVPSTYDTVEGNTESGIVIRANRVYVTFVAFDGNGGNGIVVKPRDPATVVSKVYLSNVEASRNGNTGFLLDSLSSFAAWSCTANDNRADGVDLTNSVNSAITDGYANGNAGDGVKIVGGHNDVVGVEGIGESSHPNEIGLEVRNSDFDTVVDNEIFYNTEDGLLMVNGNGENIINVGSDGNGGNGIHLKRITSSRVQEDGAGFNTGAGIWLDASSGISVEDAQGFNNGASDLYIGCSPTREPAGTTCASRGLPASNGNRVVGGDFRYSSGTKPDVGIGIDEGNHHNQVFQNMATGNAKDAVDMNTNCDSNQWALNTFTITSPPQPSCIQ